MRLLCTLMLAILGSDALSAVSYKVKRDSAGNTVSFGVNDKNYDPSLKNGEILSIEHCDECDDNTNFYHLETVDNLVLDYVSKQNEQPCQSKFDCDASEANFTCQEGKAVKNYETLSNYCAVNVMKIDGKKLQNNPTKKVAYDLKEAKKATLEAGLALVQKARNCGSRAINLMSLRNAQKGLSKLQRKQIIKDFADIKDQLDVGSLDNAKDSILATVADGVIITEADKTEMIAFINSCQ